MKSYDAWQEEINQQIEVLKQKGRKSHYLINAKMSQETASSLEVYFTKAGYSFEKRRCHQCAGFDIILTWK